MALINKANPHPGGGKCVGRKTKVMLYGKTMRAIGYASKARSVRSRAIRLRYRSEGRAHHRYESGITHTQPPRSRGVLTSLGRKTLFSGLREALKTDRTL